MTMENLSVCRNEESSSSADDCSTLVGVVITKEMIDEENALDEKAPLEEKEMNGQLAKQEKNKLKEQSADDYSTLIGGVITKEMIDEEKAILEEKEMNEQLAKQEKNKLEEQSADDYSTLVGDVITKEMIDEEKALEKKAILEEKEMNEQLAKQEKNRLEEQCYKRLNLLLSRSSIYAEFMSEKLKRDELKKKKRRLKAEKAQSNSQEQKKRKKETNMPGKKRRLMVCDESLEEDENENIENESNNFNETKIETIPDGQPPLLTGAVMHPYQIEGFEWIKTLFENGVNGILADEMGLGKTIQTIAFIAHLIGMGVSGPFFVCGPLSTVPNWYSEFRRFTPNIPVLMYHGPKDDRKLIRSKIQRKVRSESVFCFPVLITSYQIALIDAKLLSRYDWKILVIDEAHRIKNFQCKLVCALKLYNASHRLLLTGTPLQNNLSELWSLLNFILPEIFDDLKVFQSWFDVSNLTKREGTDNIIAKEQEKQIVSIIHQILTPFLLRRTKAEVSLKIPPKKEVIVHAPLTKLQQEYYSAALNKTIQEKVGDNRGKYFNVDVDLNSSRPVRDKNFSFTDIYKLLDDDKFQEIPDAYKKCVATATTTASESKPFDLSEIRVNVRNITMILRKICGHPYLVSYPLNPDGMHKIDENLIKNSGKLLVLDAMLPELKKRGHKVVLFTQFVMMIDILEDYFIYRNYNYNVLCGTMRLDERQKEIDEFNKSEESFIFVISTKAGGLGINLATADTVIIYDSDWNPQGDLQAQDRCHRIGQTKPVIVYRLKIPNTVDERIIDVANAKRKLEKVIIKKGRFNSTSALTQSPLSIDELLELLQSCDSKGFVKTDDNCVLSPAELNKLLDRSDMIESA